MRSLVLFTVVIGCSVSRADPGPNYEHLKPLEQIVGQWAISGQWADGTVFIGEESTQWALDKNFLVSDGWFQA
jgi:hypothetical protein